MKNKTELPFLEQQLLRMLKDSQGVLKGIGKGWRQVQMAAYLHGLDMKFDCSWQSVWCALQPSYQRPPVPIIYTVIHDEFITRLDKLTCLLYLDDYFDRWHTQPSLRLPEEVLNGKDTSWGAECSKADPLNDLRSMQEVVRNQVGYYE